MSNIIEAPAQKPSETVARLEAARQAGSVFAWIGLGLALAWWGAATAGALSLFGWETISQGGPAIILAGVFAILVPGFMLVLAGFLARENARAGASNAIVLEAASQLLTPAEKTSAETVSFAREMAKASDDIDRSMGHALSAMKAMAGEIGDERQRLESVTYASADNARELGQRLGTERSALEQLAKDLREQTDLLSDAIPRQATMMVDSAKAAATEVGSAEEALKSRLEGLDQVGRTLAQKIAAMDTLAAEAGERNETLLFAIARMEEKLEQSRKTVETASRAGELAAAAAGTTGDRLMDAVRAALDGAREANAEIQNRSLEASESAAKSLADLKEAGEQAAAAIRAAGMAARAELETAELQTEQATKAMRHHTRTAPKTQTNGADHALAAAPEIKPSARSQSPATSAVSPSQAMEEDLFDLNADRMAQAMLAEARSERASAPRNGADEEPMMLKRGIDDDVFDRPTAYPVAKSGRNGDNSLSEIIADMESDDQPKLSREDTADTLIERLSDSGIRLTDIFRPKHKKKIALMARKGDKQRRSATGHAAGRQVERLRQRLRGDAALMGLARDFLALEETDALNALENTHTSNKNASARLATYLLVDAALD
ncbi:MAG: hypothetical protein AAF613_01730 [Pseudomonadota bacterium]